MDKIEYNINLIYSYITPYGIIDNGYNAKTLKKIFLNSLSKKDDSLYTSKFREYCNYLVEKNKYKINYINQEDVWKTPSMGDFINLYVFENLDDKEFRIGNEMIETMSNVDNFYFIILDEKNTITDKFISDIKKFKLDKKINRFHFFYFSKLHQEKNVECIKDTLSFDFSRDNLIDIIINKIQDQKNKFL